LGDTADETKYSLFNGFVAAAQVKRIRALGLLGKVARSPRQQRTKHGDYEVSLQRRPI
jgi:citrate lyase beta subunit